MIKFVNFKLYLLKVVSNMISILIIDDDLNFVKELFNRIIKQNLNIKLVGIGENGSEAIKLIEYYKPDVLLLDLMMPHINGIQVLDIMISKKDKYFPNIKIIILSSFIEKLYKNKEKKYFNYIYDIIPKPININKLLNCLNQIEEYNSIEKIKLYVSNELMKFNFNINNGAYKYLNDAIIEVIKNNTNIFNLERDIYFNVAKKYHKKNSKIIKWSIDKLIARMYLNTDMKKIHDYFNFKFDEKPSTKFFIYTISEKYFSQKKEG